MKLIVSVLFFFASFYPSVSFAGRCTGSGDCKACTTCSSCKHCNRDGGSCSVCGGGDDNSVSYATTSRPAKKDNTHFFLWLIIIGLTIALISKKNKT